MHDLYNLNYVVFDYFRFWERVWLLQNNCQEYNNGVFLALIEGLYRITVSLDSMRDEDGMNFQADILKDSIEILAFCETEKWQTTSMHTVVYMEKYRMVQVRLLSGTLLGRHSNTGVITGNLIQVEQLS